MLTNLRTVMAIICGLAYAACTPSGSGSQSAAPANAGQVSLGTTTATVVVSGSLTKAALEAMSPADLQKTYTSLTTQAQSDIEQYSIDDQISTLLCQRLQTLRSDCASSNTLIPSADPTLNCAGTSTGSLTAITTASPILVTLVDGSDSLLPSSSANGQYILVANGNYISSPFGAGANVPITFTSNLGANATVEPPELKQVYRLELRRATEPSSPPNGGGATGTGTATTSSTTTELPIPSSNFGVLLKYQGTVLISGSMITYDDPSWVGYRYLLNVGGIQANASSSSCVVSAAEISNIKTQVNDSVTSQTAFAAKQALFAAQSSPLTGDQMIAAILKAQSQISQFSTAMDSTENTLLMLNNELAPTDLIGCHADEPITTLYISLTGNVAPPKSIGNWNQCPTPTLGPSPDLRFEMGSSVVVNIDESTSSNIGPQGGTPWQGTLEDQALVGDIEYLRISKLGITYDDGGPECTSGLLGINGKCLEICTEINVYNVTGVTVAIDTPSVAHRTIYDNQNLNLVFGSSLYSPAAVTRWTEENFRANDDWVVFMQDTDCDTQN